MTTPLLAPPEAQPTERKDKPVATESLGRPFRLGLVGLGAGVGLSVRLLSANEVGLGELNSRPVMLAVALASAVMGLGMLLMAAARDRFGPSLSWIAAITSLAWGALNWISPPFAEAVTVWSKPDQAVLAVLGIGNGMLLAGLVALAFVRRHPTLTVAAVNVSAVFTLAANTAFLRNEWIAIVLLGITFALILLAWDRSPRRELAFERPADPPRVSRAALSFIAVAMGGTAIQLWTSRTDIPRSIPAVVVSGVLIVAAFATLVGVRREIEKRGTTLSEWTSWAREIRTNDFRAEMQNFESDGVPSPDFDARGTIGTDGEAPRKLSFPNLAIPDAGIDSISANELAAAAADLTAADSVVVGDLVPDAVPVSQSAPAFSLVVDTAPVDGTLVDAPTPLHVEPEILIPSADAGALQPSGAFSSVLAGGPLAETDSAQVADLDALAAWLRSPVAAARTAPLLVAIEALSLDEYDSLPPNDAAMATSEIGSFLAETMPDADLVSWIDGPYFIVAYGSKPASELLGLNKVVLKSLKGTDGTLAILRPAADAELDDIVNECVMGLLQARRAKERAAGR